MESPAQSFPQGIAVDAAFINREHERKRLINRVDANQHTVLMAPRRYGKTSLVVKVADEMKLPYCHMDLLAAFSEDYVRELIIEKISALVFEILPRAKKAKQQLIDIFHNMKPEITIGAMGQRLSLSLSKDPLQDITNVLLKLNETAKVFNKKVVVFMDEFQQISQLKNFHAIEASIRHAVERSQHVAYVFSGSNRRLLQQMFGSQDRALYRLCDMITLDRMSQSVYEQHLQNLAIERWKKPLADSVLAYIFTYTELHPYYINVLCQRLWQQKQCPDESLVQQIWSEYVVNQRQIIAHDLADLSVNQKRLVIALANNPVSEIQSAQFSSSIKLSPSSAKQALQVLLNKDLVYQRHDGCYTILDPAMACYLRDFL